jgi:thioredoxin 1
MKKIFYSASVITIFLLLTTASRSDVETEGIIFFDGTWQEALKKSAKENKLIFLDLSTSWCGWCKKMRQTTYPDKKVGAYFNARFINMELDGESGEGQRLARKYGVTGYPSLYLVDKNENQMLSSEGYHDADDLIRLIKAAVKEVK